jgi:hypothetical protein
MVICLKKGIPWSPASLKSDAVGIVQALQLQMHADKVPTIFKEYQRTSLRSV